MNKEVSFVEIVMMIMKIVIIIDYFNKFNILLVFLFVNGNDKKIYCDNFVEEMNFYFFVYYKMLCFLDLLCDFRVIFYNFFLFFEG